MLAIVHIIFLTLLAGWVWKRDNGPLHKVYWAACLAKCLAGISLGIIYSTYYDTNDTFIFFQWAVDQAVVARTDPGAYVKFLFTEPEGYFLGEHRTTFFVKVTSVLALLTGDNYWVTAVYFSLISFLAAWYVSNTLARIFPEYKVAACIAFLFFPSVVFWSSGILKESLAMAALFFLTALFVKLWASERIPVWAGMLAVVCVLVIFYLKYYYLAVFIPVTGSALIMRFLNNRLRIESWAKQLLLFAGVLTVGFLAVTWLHPNFRPARLLEVIVQNNQVFMQVSAPDDVIHFYKLEPTWMSFLINMPWALISGLFRPWIWEANTIFKFITGVENFVLLVLTLLTLPHVKRFVYTSHRVLIGGTVLYCAALSILLALSTPNFGTLARYGVGFLPFFVLLVFNQPWVNRVFSRLF